MSVFTVDNVEYKEILDQYNQMLTKIIYKYQAKRPGSNFVDIVKELFGRVFAVHICANGYYRFGLLKTTSATHDVWEAINYNTLDRSLYYRFNGKKSAVDIHSRYTSTYSINGFEEFDVVFYNYGCQDEFIYFGSKIPKTIEDVNGIFESNDVMNTLKMLTNK